MISAIHIPDLVQSILAGLLVAVPTAYLTVRLSLRRFYREKWWEAKRIAYLELLEIFHHLKRSEDEYYWSLRAGSTHSDADQQELAIENGRRYRELEKHIDLAHFQLGDETIRVLETYTEDRSAAESNDPDDLHGLHRDALAKCLKSFIAAAKNDLNL